MADCKACGGWFGTTIPQNLCPACERALKRLNGYAVPVSWTQVDEALPPNGEDVLCWYEYFRFGEYNRMYQTFGIGYQFNGNWGGEVAQGQKAKVLAWIPLPKPPKMKRGVTND